jgi:hypothetical protein
MILRKSTVFQSRTQFKKMEYDIIGDGFCQPRCLPENATPNRQIVFVPTTYHGLLEPVQQSLRYAPYQNFQLPQQLPRPRPMPLLNPTVRAQSFQQAILQTQSRHAHNPNPQNILSIEDPFVPLTKSQPPVQAPIFSSVEEVLFSNGSSEVTHQDSRQTDSDGIDIPPLPETCGGDSFDTAMMSIPTASPPDTVCCSCGGNGQWIRCVNQVYVS